MLGNGCHRLARGPFRSAVAGSVVQWGCWLLIFVVSAVGVSNFSRMAWRLTQICVFHLFTWSTGRFIRRRIGIIAVFSYPTLLCGSRALANVDSVGCVCRRGHV